MNKSEQLDLSNFLEKEEINDTDQKKTLFDEEVKIEEKYRELEESDYLGIFSENLNKHLDFFWIDLEELEEEGVYEDQIKAMRDMNEILANIEKEIVYYYSMRGYYLIDVYDALGKKEYPATRYSGEQIFNKDQVKAFVHDIFYDMVDSGDWVKITFVKEEDDEC